MLLEDLNPRNFVRNPINLILYTFSINVTKTIYFNAFHSFSNATYTKDWQKGCTCVMQYQLYKMYLNTDISCRNDHN